MDKSWNWSFLYLDHKGGKGAITAYFSLVLLSSRDFFILKVNYSIQVYKINLDLHNPVTDLFYNLLLLKSQLTNY